jgi:hypothetical protein
LDHALNSECSSTRMDIRAGLPLAFVRLPKVLKVSGGKEDGNIPMEQRHLPQELYKHVDTVRVIFQTNRISNVRSCPNTRLIIRDVVSR